MNKYENRYCTVPMLKNSNIDCLGYFAVSVKLAES